MRNPVPVVLAGPHARLEPLGPQHVADLFVAGQDDEVWRWLPVARPGEPADVARLVEQARADPGRLAFAAVVDGRAVGSTSYLDVDLEVAGLEIGWTWYARSHWATALNASCKLLLLGYAFDVLGAERVTLKTDSLNLRSQAGIRRLGAHEDGTLRHARRRRDGSVRDSVYSPSWSRSGPPYGKGCSPDCTAPRSRSPPQAPRATHSSYDGASAATDVSSP